MEERELILLLKQGSKDAFTALYKQYWKQVYNFSRLYLTSADAAEEVVQEVFIKIWETREFLREDDHFKGLLFIITRNLIFNRHRMKISTKSRSLPHWKNRMMWKKKLMLIISKNI